MCKSRNADLVLFLGLLCFLLINSCGEKLHEQIGYIKNNTQSDLVGGNWYKSMTDSVLCSNRVNLGYYIQPGLSESLITRPVDLNKEPDSSKEYIYIFNSDSLNKYEKLKICGGIVKHCLVKKIEIQLNQVKGLRDTIFINSSKPIDY